MSIILPRRQNNNFNNNHEDNDDNNNDKNSIRIRMRTRIRIRLRIIIGISISTSINTTYELSQSAGAVHLYTPLCTLCTVGQKKNEEEGGGMNGAYSFDRGC